jgi:hypothetical protein
MLSDSRLGEVQVLSGLGVAADGTQRKKRFVTIVEQGDSSIRQDYQSIKNHNFSL